MLDTPRRVVSELTPIKRVSYGSKPGHAIVAEGVDRQATTIDLELLAGRGRRAAGWGIASRSTTGGFEPIASIRADE